MKIAIYYTHSETLGHSRRIQKISEYFVRKGHEVLVLQGGIPQPFLKFHGVKLINIPYPLYGRERFYAESKKILDYSLINKRIRIMKENILKFKPDILFTDYFPFGRLEGEYELFPLLNFIKKRFEKIKIYATIGYPIFGSIISKKIVGFSQTYDKIFIHTPIIEKHYAERFYPDRDVYNKVFRCIEDKVIFTGYVTDSEYKQGKHGFEKEKKMKELGKRKLVVVSRGGGVIYPRIISDSLLLARELDNFFFFITAGPATTNNQWNVFKKMSSGIDNVELKRYAPNLQQFIYSSDLSVNMSGYNTSVELLLGRKKSIVIPLISDAEQAYRAKLLHDFLGASVIVYKKLSLEILEEQINYQMNLDIKPKINNEWFNGLQVLEESLD